MAISNNAPFKNYRITGHTATESLKMLQSCITGVSAGMAQSKLKLNPSKTELGAIVVYISIIQSFR